MKYNTSSKVEEFFKQQDIYFELNKDLRRIPTITVDNYVVLGQITALRFLEWVSLNPGGVVALPTGKTPEFFIKWMQHYLDNWDQELKSGILGKIGFDPKLKPDFKSLHFFQLDEFFPIDPEHERSFTWFVKEYYLKGFGFDPQKANLINTYHFTEAQKKILGSDIDNVYQIFPDGVIDLSLRVAKLNNEHDMLLRQKTIKLFDQFCNDYEEKLRNLGGIGFFLGGIGPDGHIAFNVRGSSHHSHTRLTQINYETQAAASSDLGGIELVRKKAVITMGLETITYNPDCVAVIIAAGESKAKVIKDAIEKEPNLEFPATALHKLKNARFFITASAGIKLSLSEKSILQLKQDNTLPEAFAEKMFLKGVREEKTNLIELSNSAPKKLNEYFSIAEKITGKTTSKQAEEILESLQNKIERGIKPIDNQRFMHTGPHHDDIELAYFPLIHHMVRSERNDNWFVYCTSGYTAVTNFYVIDVLTNLNRVLNNDLLMSKVDIKRLKELKHAQDDCTGYLNGIAKQDIELQEFFVSMRVARRFLADKLAKELADLKTFVAETLEMVKKLDPGRRQPELMQKLKGWLREFEAELPWAHFGIGKEKVRHLQLPFYTDDIFPQYPDKDKDVLPILNLMEEIKPTIITLALDPEGSGPDTHYKTLMALSAAIDEYMKNNKESNLRIWGYRNVWSRFEPSDVNMIVPVSLNSFAVLHSMFDSCFLSQKSASFPSYEIDGTFSELAQKVWVEQYDNLMNLIGKDYFYNSPNPMMRRSYGAILIRDMSYKEFTHEMLKISRLLKAKEGLQVK